MTYNSIQREKEELHNRIIQLEKKLDEKQALELEIEQLKGTLNVMEHMGDGDDEVALKKTEALLQELREKEEEREHAEALTQTLIIKEHKSNDELQEARKELINVSISTLIWCEYMPMFRLFHLNQTIVICKKSTK